jgi:hypothetical protein
MGRPYATDCTQHPTAGSVHLLVNTTSPVPLLQLACITEPLTSTNISELFMPAPSPTDLQPRNGQAQQQHTLGTAAKPHMSHLPADAIDA